MDGVASELATSCQCIQRRKRKYSSSHSSSSFPLHSTTKRSSYSASVSSEAPPTWLYLTVWVAAVVVYLNGLTGDFVHDDVSAVRTNPDVLGTTPLYQVFLNDYWGRPMADPRSHKSYRPLTILSFRLNHHLCGLRPLGFHLVNVLLHSCVCLLFTHLLLRLLRLPQGTVLSVALIFATHPIHTEAVTGVVGRADLLAAITFLAVILAYHRAIEDDNTNLQNSEGDSEREPADDVGIEEDLSHWDTSSRRYTSLDGNTSSSSSNQVGRQRNPTSKRYMSLDGGTCSSNSVHTGRLGNHSSWRYSSLDGSTSVSSNSHTDRLGNSISKRYLSLDGSSCCSPILRPGNLSNTAKYTQRVVRGPPSGMFVDTLRGEKGVVRKKGELWRGDAGLWWVWRAGLLAGVGTLCKEHAITSLAFCAFWDIIQHRKHIARLLQKEPANPHLYLMMARFTRLGVLCGGMLGARLWVGGGSPPVFSNQDNPAACQSSVLTRLLTLWYLPAVNVWLVLCPWQLSHDWQMGSIPLITSFTDPRNLATLLFYVGLLLVMRGGFMLKGRVKGPGSVLAGLALLVLPFLPATNLFFTVGFVVAERVLYIPSLGYSVVVGVGLSRLRRLRAPGLLLLLLLFSCRTITRNKDWQDREALFRSGLRAVPHNAKMHYNFANLQKDLGNLDLARVHYQEAIRLWPGYSSAHNNLATLLNDTVAAEAHFRLALKAHPQHVHAHFNLAILRKQQGETSEAVRLLEESLRYDPTNREAVVALAALYSDSGRVGEADTLHLGLLASRPKDTVARNNYATFLHNIGRSRAAVEQYEAVLVMQQQQQQQQQPRTLFKTSNITITSTTVSTNSMTARDESLLSSQTRELVTRALEVGMEAEVGERLAGLYFTTSRLMEAEATLAAILEVHPHRHSSVVLLAQVAAEQRRYRESEQLLRGVLITEPNHPEALQHLSLLYAHTNRTDAAQHPALEPPHCNPAHKCSPPKTPPLLTAELHTHRQELVKEVFSGGG